MLKITLSPAALALALTATAAHADVDIFDNNRVVTVDCAKDKVVNVAGNKAVITLTGTCERVNISGNNSTVKGSVTQALVSGNSNALTLDAVDAIAVSGNKNTVTFKKTIKEKSARVAVTGKDNKVNQEK